MADNVEVKGGSAQSISKLGGRRYGGSAFNPVALASVGAKGSVRQPAETYSYRKNVGVGSPDTREARNRIGYKDYRAGAASNAQSSFEDLLASLLGGGGGGGGGSRRAYSDAQIAETQARLQAVYDRYAQDIADREAAIGSMYDTAGTSLGSIYDTSTSNIAKAYEAARAAQTQQLLALGMTEQTPVAQFGNETAATTSLQNLRAAILAQNEATKKAAITNQRLASEAAKREGAARIAQTVAQMQSEMVSYGGGGGGGGLSPYQYASLLLKNREMDQNAQITAAKMAAAEAANQPKAKPSVQAALDAAANYKGTPEQLAAFKAFYGKV